MYMHSSNEIDKRINVSKIANNISTMGDNSTAVKAIQLYTNLRLLYFILLYSTFFPSAFAAWSDDPYSSDISSRTTGSATEPLLDSP